MPVRVSTSTSLTCTAAEKPRPTWMPPIVIGTARTPRSPPRVAVRLATGGAARRGRCRCGCAAPSRPPRPSTRARRWCGCRPRPVRGWHRRRAGRSARRPRWGRARRRRRRRGRHGAAAGAHVLHGGRRRRGGPPSTETATSQSGSTKVHPVGRGDPDAPAEATGLAARRRALLPRRQRARPAVERLALRVAVPLCAQLDGVTAGAVRRLVDGLLERPGDRRSARATEGGAGRRVRHDVDVAGEPRGAVVDEHRQGRDAVADGDAAHGCRRRRRGL